MEVRIGMIMCCRTEQSHRHVKLRSCHAAKFSPPVVQIASSVARVLCRAPRLLV